MCSVLLVSVFAAVEFNPAARFVLGDGCINVTPVAVSHLIAADKGVASRLVAGCATALVLAAVPVYIVANARTYQATNNSGIGIVLVAKADRSANRSTDNRMGMAAFRGSAVFHGLPDYTGFIDGFRVQNPPIVWSVFMGQRCMAQCCKCQRQA
ncbi:hypothetical protein QWI17_05490 [Gilvimarinus sp. SDUM040013]|uniref:Uncharacterized protein n=1 Tax=Gilvimarinus gilvus TaxID=3058038 RepID=A0ABU4RX78_9GAMM|nr:hypothetical protein [Gilvimarinus sp. SDUM040013]MDO3385291.1 hypothetical protein [Gilvimarinus sp. SDUM040013]MDX6849274.1 hypothetical protein [Gilvimarinus sp. SDUM040013]